MSTIVYLIRHGETLKNINDTYNEDNLLDWNKKRILSVSGEKKVEEFAKKSCFNGINAVISSNYVRAISTAKYFAFNNNVPLMINDKFNERIHGVNSWNELPTEFELKQMTFSDFKIGYGESQDEVRIRMLEGLKAVLDNFRNQKVLIVSHATAISYLLKEWCEVIYQGDYKFKDKVFFDGEFNPLEAFKLEFDDNDNLISIESIK